MKAGASQTIPVFIMQPGNTTGQAGIGFPNMTVNYWKNGGATNTKTQETAAFRAADPLRPGRYHLVMHATELDTPGWLELTLVSTTGADYNDRFQLDTWNDVDAHNERNALLTSENAVIGRLGPLQTSVDGIYSHFGPLQTSEDIHYTNIMASITSAQNTTVNNINTVLAAMVPDIRRIRQSVSGLQELNMNTTPPILTVYDIDDTTALYTAYVDDTDNNIRRFQPI